MEIELRDGNMKKESVSTPNLFPPKLAASIKVVLKFRGKKEIYEK